MSVHQANQDRAFTDKSIALFLSTSVIVAEFVKGLFRTTNIPLLRRNMDPGHCLAPSFGQVGWAVRKSQDAF